MSPRNASTIVRVELVGLRLLVALCECAETLPKNHVLQPVIREALLSWQADHDPDHPQPTTKIVGWMVGNDPQTAAMYNASHRDDAMDAARRWNVNLTALVVHPGAPVPSAEPPQSADGTLYVELRQ